MDRHYCLAFGCYPDRSVAALGPDLDYLATLADWPQLLVPDAQRKLLYESIRRMLSEQVYDVINSSRAQLQSAKVSSVQDVRLHGQVLIAFSDEMKAESQRLKQFLFKQLYRHPQVMQTMDGAQQVVRELFAAYMVEPERMKPRFVQRVLAASTLNDRARVVADFIAGMTDRYAASEHERVTGLRLIGD